jgi:hypothetical protein
MGMVSEEVVSHQKDDLVDEERGVHSGGWACTFGAYVLRLAGERTAAVTASAMTYK